MSDEIKTRITKIQAVPLPMGGGDACVVLIYPPGPDMGRRYVLDRSELIIGRGGDCDVQVDIDSVSRRHARIFRDEHGWLVQDLGSTNGSYVNDRPIEQAPLRDGDLVKIGKTILKFLSGANVEASYHEEIYRMTILDALTGVYNKRYFLEFLERELARAVRHSRVLSLVMLDLDHFKDVNDRHGHLAGDLVLKEVGRRLMPRIRREELVARYGGEEFAAVLPESTREGALHFAEQVRELVACEPFVLDAHTQLAMTVSAGVASVEGEPIDASAFIKRADECLYQAKRAGRNCVVG